MLCLLTVKRHGYTNRLSTSDIERHVHRGLLFVVLRTEARFLSEYIVRCFISTHGTCEEVFVTKRRIPVSMSEVGLELS